MDSTQLPSLILLLPVSGSILALGTQLEDSLSRRSNHSMIKRGTSSKVAQSQLL
ncbi:hypothetical protein PILCRDRAFT_824839 [Piloderma croceum F 1598]|uniref:Uncharacterized protein n=1 Tax=Piloderma croceum (strain F 1598) TaxID=765440 RepID=A0A0C3FDY6_PILCF|nr:hypothetical protein PILCRDRAFT_824839 [Piloderma croceum F 1598]